MKIRKDFLGLDGFYWWFGVVESRKDPKGLGRCQVRIYGAHNASLSDIPSEDLPWAHPVHALNNQMFSTPKEGDMVFGFFLDGKFAQQPVMIGIVPTIPTEIPVANIGFNDVRTPEELADSPKKPRAINYGTNDGTGARIVERQSGFDILRNPYDTLNYPSNSDLARNERIKGSFIQARRDSLISADGAFGTSWQEPFPAYAAKYPYNRVLETESGHIQEFDDTPGAERIHTAHRSGTFEEIYPTGTKVEKIVKDNYKIILADDHLYVSGKVHITVQSDANIKVEGDINLEGRGDLTVGVAGDMNFSVGGDFRLKAHGIYTESKYETNIKAGGAVRIGSDRGLHLTTQAINLATENDLTISSAGKLTLSGGDIVLQATDSVGVLSGTKFNVASPVSDFMHLNALTTSLFAYGTDSHGDSHVLSVGIGTSAPIVLPTLASSLYIMPPSSAFLGDAPSLGDPNFAAKNTEPTPVQDSAVFFDSGDDPAAADEYIKKQIDNGIYTKQEIDAGNNAAKAPTQSDPNPTQNKSVSLPVKNDCGGLDIATNIPENTQLSKYYTLAELTTNVALKKTGKPLVAQHGLTKGQIACNLKLLAVNCLDKIKEKYPTMVVTNAFRYPESSGSTAGKSQHETGQAADIQFPGMTPSNYYNIALWIKDNVPYDQLILEYSAGLKGNPWIHISYNKSGNRPIGSNKTITMVGHKVTNHSLVNLISPTPKVSPVKPETTTIQKSDGTVQTVETKPIYNKETDSYTNQTTTTTTDATGNVTTEVKSNDGIQEIVKTEVKNSSGSVVKTIETIKNLTTQDPRNGPGGILTRTVNSAFDEVNNQVGAAAAGVARNLVRSATAPLVRQIENGETFVGNLADQIETIVSDVNKAVCTIYHDGKELPGKIRREYQRIKEQIIEKLDLAEDIRNKKLTLKGVVAKAALKISRRIAEELDNARIAILKKINDEADAIYKRMIAELTAIGEELNKVYERLYGAYDRLVVKRAERNKKLVDDIKTKSNTSC